MGVPRKSNPVNTALCSFGMSGRIFHAPFLKISPHFHVSAVWERTKELSKAFFPGVKIYRTLNEILCDEGIELVIVNTPNSTHYEYARKALISRKHVVIEKPFTITAKEGIHLKNLAERNGLILSVYHNRRFDSDFKTICHVLQSKKLGRIVEAEMRFDRYRTEPGKKKHKEQPGSGTGNLYDLGSHLLDQAIYLFGMPEKIFADIDILRSKSKVDDFFEVILFYPDKLRVRIHSSYLAPEVAPGYIFFGEKGAFSKRKSNVQEEELTLGKLPNPSNWGTEKKSLHGKLVTFQKNNPLTTIVPSLKGNYGDFYEKLYSAIRNQTALPVTSSDGIRVIHLIECAYESNRLKKVVKVPEIKM